RVRGGVRADAGAHRRRRGAVAAGRRRAQVVRARGRARGRGAAAGAGIRVRSGVARRLAARAPMSRATRARREDGPDVAGADADVAAFLQHLVAVRNASPNTVRAYRADLADFFAWLPPDRTVDRLELRRWLVELQQRGLKPSSIQRKLA